MCGITGFVGRRPVLARSTLERMRDSLTHRGPDSAGLVLWDEEGRVVRGGEAAVCGLAHRRLSIIDLSEAGHQPMCNEKGDVWISYNGEFYNFEEYREELEKKGHRVASRTDTETIVHLYEEYGIEETLSRLNGMFAFAVWDQKSRSLVLARDRIGKKPLFYLQTPDGALLFASEIKALLASGLVDEEQIDDVALDQFWTFGYILGERTIYRQVRQLPAGHYAVWADGELRVHEFWDCPFGVDVWRDRSLDDLADELESLLLDSVRLRLIADVPVGVFLSGGIDSSLVAAIAGRLTGNRIETFTIGFDYEKFNEVPYARAVAEHLGMKNEVFTVRGSLADDFERIAQQFDEPFGDSSAIPTYYLSRLTRASVTVALSGDAGDELFAGYDNYRRGLSLWGGAAMRGVFPAPKGLRNRLHDLRLRAAGPRRGFTLMERLIGRRHRSALFSEAFRAGHAIEEVYRDREKWLDRVKGADLLSAMQYTNLKTYLPDDILVKVDRMSMAHSLECRAPLLDYRIMEFASRLPFRAKMDGQGRGKVILRKILSRHVPETLYERPKKGFGTPWEHWCQEGMGAELRQRWEKLSLPTFNRTAGEELFPAGTCGNPRLQWNAFSMLSHWGRKL